MDRMNSLVDRLDGSQINGLICQPYPPQSKFSFQ